MSKTKKPINLVEEPDAETYQIPLEQKVIQFLRIAETLPPTKLQEIVEKLEQLIRTKPIDSDFSLFLLEGPIMSDTQLESFHEQRKLTNQWRVNSSF
jgi:hypothetical protein